MSNTTSQADLAVEAIIRTITVMGPEMWRSDKGESFNITLQIPKGIKVFLDELFKVTPEKALGDSPENLKNAIFRTLVLRGLTYSALGGDKMSELIETIYSGILSAEERPNPLSEILDKVSADELKRGDTT